MPLYEYHCPANDRTLEVRHGMREDLRTWGELAAAAAVEPGDTPPEAEVRRLIRGGSLLLSSHADEARPSGGCGPYCACHGG